MTSAPLLETCPVVLDEPPPPPGVSVEVDDEPPA
jgi:hypothetical protein